MEKKRGRKKQSTTTNTTQDEPVEKIPKKRGRKPKGGKIITEPTNININQEIKPNIILHLKCKLEEITKTDAGINEYVADNIETIIHYNIEQQHKHGGLQYDVIEDENKLAPIPDKTLNSTEIVKTDQFKELSAKLKQLTKILHNNMDINDNSACFWCTCNFNNESIYIPQYKKDDGYCCYGNFCSPNCAAGYLFQENIDTSVKYERYQLLNYIYSKVYNYEKNIIPASSPHYLLDKFCGNLTIDEYRKLNEQDKIILVMDKPLSRNYPELFEENNEFQIHTINSFSKKKKENSKQNIFQVN